MSSPTKPLLPPAGGTPPPDAATLPDGTVLFLAPLAHETCRRYRAEFPDEEERYGDSGFAWCVHDTQYLLSWAAAELTVGGVFEPQLRWLTGVLAARDFPLDRLERDLELAAVDLEQDHGDAATPAAAKLREGARLVRRDAGEL